MDVYGIVTRPEGFAEHSGLWPAVRAVGMEPVEFGTRWSRWQAKSWTAGQWLREWGNHWYGSGWNALTPWWDERAILSALPRGEPHVVHWLWGEFAAPKRADVYRKRGGKVVVSVHCSARRWEKVWLRPDGYAQADCVVLTSESQRPFVERDVPRERVKTILHGVESGYFTPGRRMEEGNKRLRMFLFGNTERDHAFAAEVAKRLPPERFEWRVRTMAPEKNLYADIPCVTMLPRLSDDEVLEEYRQADLLCMPMLDSAANNVFLESMACGTPVMTNRVGGVPEYVPEVCNAVMPNDAVTDAWAGRLVQLEKNRELLQNWRPAARRWAEGLDWAIIAEEYRKMYRELKDF
jgi:glycosyltransferase involved in cell wall biosynthesis